MNFGLTFLRTHDAQCAYNFETVSPKPNQCLDRICFGRSLRRELNKTPPRKWVETMFRTWYSASQIYTTIVIIFASSGMDLYFVPRCFSLRLPELGTLRLVKNW